MLPSELTAIVGLDVERGLKTLNGNQAVFIRLLRRFAIENANDTVGLRGWIEQSEWDEARRLAHSLKGVAGNLGAIEVQRMAGELEAAIRARRDAAAIEWLSVQLEGEMDRISSAIRAALPGRQTIAPVGEVDWPLVRQVLDELEPLLLASSLRTNHLVESHDSLLKAAFGPLALELSRYVEHFHYPEALQTLNRARLTTPELAEVQNRQRKG